MRFDEDNEDDAKGSPRETAQRPTYENIWEIKDWEVQTRSIPESTDDAVGHDPNAFAVIKAINTGIPGAVKAALAKMDAATAVQALSNEGCLGRIAIMHAALRGDLELFNVVLCEMRSRLKKKELREALTTITGHDKESLLISAAKGGNNEIFNNVVKLLDGAILDVTVQQFHYGSDVLKASARHGSLDTFNTVSQILKNKLDLDQSCADRCGTCFLKALEMVSTNNSIERSILTTSFMSGDGYALGAWAVVLSRTLPQDEMIKACVASFAYCAQHRSGHHRGLAVLIANGANASPEDLIRFAKTFTLDSLKECFVDAFSWVDNPFIPGMAILVALNETVPKAPEREGRVLLQLMDTVTGVLSEVLKRLPQTLHEFEGGADGCKLMLEPETVEPYPAGFAGPLRLALDMQQFTETFCVAPLVFEYLSRQFVAGLPNMRDTENILRPPDRGDASSMDEWMGLKNLYNDGLVAHTGLGKQMQGIWSTVSRAAGNLVNPKRLYKLWGTTILPGAQFVAVSVLTRPETLYNVPAMRLALDFVVHVIMLLLYTGAILTAEDGSLTVTECLLIIHVMAAIFGEFIELYHGSQEYFRDKWNWLDMISLFLLASALYIRGWGGDDGIVTVKVLFALSAPLLFARFLFFAQILRRQGVVIEMITNMLGQFLHFGLVMVVIMVGFAVAFIALIVDDTTTFGTVFVDVFNAMMGDTGVFDDYVFINSFWMSVLNIAYLVIMTIVMLNLLIAVLSTEHAKVDERSDYSFGVSKIRMIKLYRIVVDTDLLSPPFNLVQLAISLPFYLADALFGIKLLWVVHRAVGVTIFWCVTGPIAVILGTLLWLLSIPKAVVATWEGTHFGGYSLLSRFLSCSVVFIFYLGGACFVLLSFWLYSGFVGVMFLLRISSPASWSDNRANVATSVFPRRVKSQQGIEPISVQKMLRQAPGGLGVREIWEYIEDPHSATSSAMRREEHGLPATVDHIRRLENNLNALREAMVGISLRVDNVVISREAKASVNHEGLEDEQPWSRILEMVSRLEEKVDKIQIKGSQ